MASEYYHVTDGELIEIPRSGKTKTQCCDCALIHFEVYKLKYPGKPPPKAQQPTITVRVFRDGPATGGARSKAKRGKDL